MLYPLLINYHIYITIIQLTDVSTCEDIQSRFFQHIGKEVHLFESVFNGVTYVPVRKLVDNKYPTKDGITLILQRCNELFMCLPYLDIAVNMMELNQQTFYRRQLGGNWHVTVQSGFKCVDIRKFWILENATEMCATMKGIFFLLNSIKNSEIDFVRVTVLFPNYKTLYRVFLIPNNDLQARVECTPK